MWQSDENRRERWGTNVSASAPSLLEPLLRIFRFLHPCRSSEVSFIQRVVRYLLFMETTQKKRIEITEESDEGGEFKQGRQHRL